MRHYRIQLVPLQMRGMWLLQGGMEWRCSVQPVDMSERDEATQIGAELIVWCLFAKKIGRVPQEQLDRVEERILPLLLERWLLINR